MVVAKYSATTPAGHPPYKELDYEDLGFPVVWQRTRFSSGFAESGRIGCGCVVVLGRIGSGCVFATVYDHDTILLRRRSRGRRIS